MYSERLGPEGVAIYALESLRCVVLRSPDPHG
jgi:hypothetical protein